MITGAHRGQTRTALSTQSERAARLAWDNVQVPMSIENTPETQLPEAPADASTDSTESFGDALRDFERSHLRPDADNRQVEATVVSLSSNSVFLDIGFKIEGVLPRTAFDDNAEFVNPGDRILVSVKGRNEEGYYSLSRQKIAKVTDWASLEHAFAEKSPIVGTVTGAVKGGLTVDIGHDVGTIIDTFLKSSAPQRNSDA